MTDEVIEKIDDAGTAEVHDTGKPVENGKEASSTTDAAATGTTALETGTAAEKPVKESPWPDNWRELIAEGAGKDAEDLRKVANKYGGPQGMAKALLNAQREISTRGLVKTKPEDASDAKAMAEWRKSVGVPEDPTGYKLPETVVKSLGDDDKPVLANFTEFAHSKDARPDVVEIASEWYLKHKQQVEEAQAVSDQEARNSAEDELRKEWVGAEYKGNMNLAKRFLDESPWGSKGWAELRGPDGRKYGDDPAFLKWASDLGRERYGDAVFVSSDVASKHESRMQEIQTIMKTDFNRYRAEGLDKEYAQLLEKEVKRKK
jgi:hypothetical protein